MHFTNIQPSRFLLCLVILLMLSQGISTARGQGNNSTVPAGEWQTKVVQTSKKGAKYPGVLTITFAVRIASTGAGMTSVTFEFNGTPLPTSGDIASLSQSAISMGQNVGDLVVLAGKGHIKAVFTRPITSATLKGDALYLYSGGEFKLTDADPRDARFFVYATAGGRFPENGDMINRLQSSFYGVMPFKLVGRDIVSEPKTAKAGKEVKKTVWKKVE